MLTTLPNSSGSSGDKSIQLEFERRGFESKLHVDLVPSIFFLSLNERVHVCG